MLSPPDQSTQARLTAAFLPCLLAGWQAIFVAFVHGSRRARSLSRSSRTESDLSSVSATPFYQAARESNPLLSRPRVPLSGRFAGRTRKRKSGGDPLLEDCRASFPDSPRMRREIAAESADRAPLPNPLALRSAPLAADCPDRERSSSEKCAGKTRKITHFRRIWRGDPFIRFGSGDSGA